MNWITTTATIIPVVAALGGSGVYLADSRYVQISSLQAAFNQQRLKQVEDELFRLEFKIQQGTASPYDKANYERLKRERERILNAR